MTPIVLVRASGGLSNRLQAVAAAVAFCILSGRALCVDWRDGMYSDDFTNVFHRWFTVRGLPAATIEEALALAAQPEAVHPPFWCGKVADAVPVEHFFDNDHLHPDNVLRSSADWQYTQSPAPLLVVWGWDWTPALSLAPRLREAIPAYATLTDTHIVHHLVREYIIPAPDLLHESAAFAKAHFGPHTVGIHIRHTDLQSPLDKMLARLSAVAGSRDTVFLATDNAHVERAVRRMFARTVCREKYFSPVGEPLHSWTPDVSNVRKGRDALMDMLLLARCQHIIHYGISSFARVPIAWSGLPDNCIHTV